jgi:hypothetical protein
VMLQRHATPERCYMNSHLCPVGTQEHGNYTNMIV